MSDGSDFTDFSDFSEPREYQLLDGLPENRDLAEQIEELIEVCSPLSADDEAKYRRMSPQQQRKVLSEQESTAPIHETHFYVTELRKHFGGGGSGGASKKWGKISSDRGNLLSKLKHDLMFAPNWFGREFAVITTGIQAVLSALKEVHRDLVTVNSTKKSKPEVVKHLEQNEYDCLVCLKFCCKPEDGLASFLHSEKALESMAESIYSKHNKLQIVAVQILTMCCKTPGGFSSVISVTSQLRKRHDEEWRFQAVIKQLKEPGIVRFKRLCAELFNQLWRSAQLTNAKVYVQFELEQAGFDPDVIEKGVKGNDVETDLLRETLAKWRKQYISMGETRTELQDYETRNNYLREEIDRLNEEIAALQKSQDTLRNNETKWKEKCQEYRERAAELQDTVEDLKVLFVNETGHEPDPRLVKDASKALDIYGTIRIQRETKGQDDTEGFYSNSSVPEYNNGSLQSATSMPLPPVPPPSFLSKTVRLKVVEVHANLPLLHWSVLPTVTGTLFEDIDDEAKLREIDFVDFENRFKLRGNQQSKESRTRLELVLQKEAQKLSFVSLDRAKNMIITKRRIGRSTREICDAIEMCNIDVLPGEMAEQLLKYQPTKDELKQISQNVNEYSRMGEPEQFLFQLAQVTRLESKLSMLAFIGVFDLMKDKVVPDIETLHSNSIKVLNSVKLKKILEIILAFGNYMNSKKKGYAIGFKLDSLARLREVKSTDRCLTLLEYLEEFVMARYPELYDFHEDLKLDLQRAVCYQAIYADVIGLRKGIDLVKYEMEKQPDNENIFEFHQKNAAVVARLAEAFHRMEADHEKVCRLFGENYKEVDTENIFKPIQDFVENFKKAAEENKKRRGGKPPPRIVVKSPSSTELTYKDTDAVVPRLDLQSSASSQSLAQISSRMERVAQTQNKRSAIDEELYDDVMHPQHENGFYANGGTAQEALEAYYTDATSAKPATNRQNGYGASPRSGSHLGTPRNPLNDRNAVTSPIEQKGRLTRLSIDISESDYQSYINVKRHELKDSGRMSVDGSKKRVSKTYSFAGDIYEDLPDRHEDLYDDGFTPPVPQKSEKPAARKGRSAPKAPPGERYSHQVKDALHDLDRILAKESGRETISSRL